MKITHETYAAVFRTVYVGLIANLLLVLGCAPVVLLAFTTDPARSWPLFALAAPLCAPGLVGVFAVLAARDAPWRTFSAAWRGSWGRALAVGSLAVAALVVLAVDIAWAWGRTIGAAAIPVLATLMVLVGACALLALVVLAERPAVRLRDLLRVSLFLAVRRWYLTLLSLLVLALLVQVVAARPAIGLGLVAAPLLYVVWANSRFTLRVALDGATPA